jgi:hypothetical protein
MPARRQRRSDSHIAPQAR